MVTLSTPPPHSLAMHVYIGPPTIRATHIYNITPDYLSSLLSTVQVYFGLWSFLFIGKVVFTYIHTQTHTTYDTPHHTVCCLILRLQYTPRHWNVT